MTTKTRIVGVEVRVHLERGSYHTLGWSRSGYGKTLSEAIQDLLTKENVNIKFEKGEKVILKNALSKG